LAFEITNMELSCWILAEKTLVFDPRLPHGDKTAVVIDFDYKISYLS